MYSTLTSKNNKQHIFIESNVIRVSKRFMRFGTPGICVTIFYTLYGSGLLAQGGRGGGGDDQQPKNPGPNPIKWHFLPNKK